MVTSSTQRNTSSSRLSPDEVEKRLAKGIKLWRLKERGESLKELGEKLEVPSHDRLDFAVVASMFGDGNASGFPMSNVRQIPWVVMQHLTRKYLSEQYRFELASLVLYSAERDWLGQTPSPYSVPSNSNVVFNLTRQNFIKYERDVHILFVHMKKEKHEPLSEEEEAYLQYDAPDIVAASTPHIPVLEPETKTPTQDTVLSIPLPQMSIEDMVKAAISEITSEITKAFTPETGAQVTIISLTKRISELEALLAAQEERGVSLEACIGNLTDYFSNISAAEEMRVEATLKAATSIERMREILVGSRQNTEARATSHQSPNEGHSTGSSVTVTGERRADDAFAFGTAHGSTGGEGTEGGDGGSDVPTGTNAPSFFDVE